MNDDLTLALFWESWPLFADSVWSSILAGACLGYLGVYLLARQMVFLSDALSQTASFGVALSYYAVLHLGVSKAMGAPTLWSMALTLLVVWGLMSRADQPKKQDALLGAVFLLGSAGTLMLGTRITKELQDIQVLLFGAAVAVVPEDFKLMCVVLGAIFVIHLLFGRGFDAVVYDPTGARIRKMPVKVLSLLLMGTIALGISLTTKVLGALPAFAFSVLPALAVLRWSPNMQRAKWVAALLGALCGGCGYVVAFLYSLPVGATQTTLAGLFVLLSLLVARVFNRADA